MSEQRVLVVEDDRYSREVTRHMFTYHQLPVDTVASAEEALEKLCTTVYILVVIDLALPGMDGWALLNALKAAPGLDTLPCVAITAYHDSKVARQALDAGFCAYFQKPLQTTFIAQLQKTVLKH
jgi:CheY-like chemotaxis protein